MRFEIYEALKLKYESEKQTARTNLSMYLKDAVAVADHPNLVETVDKLFETISSGSMILFIIFLHSSNTGFWKAIPTVEIGEIIFLFEIYISPFVGFINPLTSLVMVDFPQPDGPTIAVNQPLLIVSDKSLKTSKEPRFVPYSWETFLISICI